MKISAEQLLAEFEELIRSMPPREKLHHFDLEIQDWLGRASALVDQWDPLKSPFFELDIGKIHKFFGSQNEDGIRGVQRTLFQARHDLRMKTVGPLSIALSQGGIFDYFDEIRKIIEEATIDLLFVDPYLDAEFASRYLPQVKAGVSIRLLTQKRVQALVPAVELLRQQNNCLIEVRTSPNLHDRYVFIDRLSCYQSGASFKDGAKKTLTTLTQIVDAFPAILTAYEQLWTLGEVASVA